MSAPQQEKSTEMANLESAPPAYVKNDPSSTAGEPSSAQPAAAAATQPDAVTQHPVQPAQAHTQHGTPGEHYSKDPAAAQQSVQMVTPLPLLGDTSAYVDCPYCQCVTLTSVAESDSSTTCLVGVVLGIFCICLACLPCIMHSYQDVDHSCSRCRKHLTHRPYGGQTVVVAGNVGNVPSKYPQQYVSPNPHDVPSQYAPTSAPQTQPAPTNT